MYVCLHWKVGGGTLMFDDKFVNVNVVRFDVIVLFEFK